MKKTKILVIDDNQAMLFIIRKALEIKKFTVETSTDYYGIDFVEKISPSLIFLDVALEGKNGCDVARELKSNKSTENIPIVLLTGNPNPEELMNESLAQCYLSKPFELVNLWKVAAQYTA